MRDRRRGLGFLGLTAVLLVVVVAGGLAGIFPFRQIIASDRAVDLAQRKLDALIEENRILEQQITALQTPEEVERLARENFGLVMPGEIGYVSVPAPGGTVSDLPSVDGRGEEDRPWWKSVWDFLTGRDLVGDD